MSSDTGGFPSVSKPSESDAYQVLYRRPRTEKNRRNRKVTRPEKLSTNDEDHSQQADEQQNPVQPSSREKSKPRPGSYAALGLNAELCQAMSAAGYNFPTPIQRKVIPSVLAGEDVVAMARTGSGKTAAFLAPLLHRLVESPLLMSTASRRNGPRALVVAPTRELVLQELKFCKLYSKFLSRGVRTAVVVGGTPLEAQFEALAVCPDIIFATPGRLLQLLAEMGAKGGLTLSTTEMLVFDEADRLFEGTLAVETAALIANLRNRQTESIEGRQTILVSATMPHALAEFSRTGLRKSLSVIRLDADKGMSPTLAVAWLYTKGDLVKDASLQVLMRRIVEEKKTCVIFAATHRRVEYLLELLKYSVTNEITCVHGNMDQTARVESVTSFRKGKAKVLVVTDVAARGIDLPDLDVVINYDTAGTPKLFVHRVGRVGRAGRFGLAFNLVTAEEIPYMLDVLLFIGRGVRHAESSASVSPQNIFKAHSFVIESSFTLGVLPRTVVDDEVEVTRNAVQRIDIEKLHSSAKNAHGLYTKTRGTASGQSVRRGKELFITAQGGTRDLNVHPWFVDMESAVERKAAAEVARLSTWRPKESLVDVPNSVLKRKRTYTGEVGKKKETEEQETRTKAKKTAGKSSNFMDSVAAMQAVDIVDNTPKLSARQQRMEEERKQFFLPSRQNASHIQSQRALKVASGGRMGDGLNAFRELQDAAMDLTADANADLLRAKHTSSSTAKYWDRVTKKFVKGGVTSATSKQNLHVASREAKARAKAGQSYGTEDGELFKKWLKKNKSSVEQLAESVQDGDGSGNAHLGFRSGLGKNDFRKGAFGRRARIAEAARNRQLSGSVDTPRGIVSNELKTRAEIKKGRKLKAKRDARHKAHLEKKRGKAPSKKEASIQMGRGSSKSKMIVRRK